jgi:WD40 repeat protein
VTLDDVFTSLQIDAHTGGVNDLAFSYPNKQLCIVTCGDDKLIKVTENFPNYNIFLS